MHSCIVLMYHFHCVCILCSVSIAIGREPSTRVYCSIAFPLFIIIKRITWPMYNGVAISPAHRTYTRTIVSFPFHSALLAMMIHSTRYTNEWENGAIFIRCDKHVMFSDSSTFIAFFRLSCVRTLCVRVMIV